MKKKNEIMLPKHELILDGTDRKVMSKKRWKQPNETLWTTVMVVGFFMMSADSFAILLLALAMMTISVFKLKGIDLSEECESGLHFNRR